MILTDAPVGIPLVVRDFSGGKRLSSHLADLGLTPGVEIQLLHGSSAGPVLLQLGENKLALGRGAASKIEVEYSI